MLYEVITGEVAALDPRAVTDIAVLVDALGVPLGLFGVDLDHAAAHVDAPTNIVKDEKFGLRTSYNFV